MIKMAAITRIARNFGSLQSTAILTSSIGKKEPQASFYFGNELSGIGMEGYFRALEFQWPEKK